MAVGGRRRSPSRWAPARRGALIALALSTALLTSGCSVYINGMTGVGVDEEGRVVGYLQICGSRVTTATLWTEGGDGRAGQWVPPDDVSDYATWLLDGSSEGWETEIAPPELKAGSTYWLNAWKSNIFDGDTRTVNVTFTLDDLEALEPGQVLSSATDYYAATQRTRVTTVDEFRETACDVLYSDADLSPMPSSSGS